MKCWESSETGFDKASRLYGRCLRGKRSFKVCTYVRTHVRTYVRSYSYSYSYVRIVNLCCYLFGAVIMRMRMCMRIRIRIRVGLQGLF